MDMEIKQKIESMQNISKIYKDFVNSELSILENADNLKGDLVVIREKLCEAKGFKKKDGSPDIAKFPASAVKGAINVSNGEEDKIGNMFSVQTECLDIVKKGEIEKGLFERYKRGEEALSRQKEEVKYLKDELSEMHDKKIIDAIHTLAKAESKTIKATQDGKKGSNDREIISIIDEVKKKLGIK